MKKGSQLFMPYLQSEYNSKKRLKLVEISTVEKKNYGKMVYIRLALYVA